MPKQILTDNFSNPYIKWSSTEWFDIYFSYKKPYKEILEFILMKVPDKIGTIVIGTCFYLCAEWNFDSKYCCPRSIR